MRPKSSKETELPVLADQKTSFPGRHITGVEGRYRSAQDNCDGPGTQRRHAFGAGDAPPFAPRAENRKMRCRPGSRPASSLCNRRRFTLGVAKRLIEKVKTACIRWEEGPAASVAVGLYCGWRK